MRMQGSTRGGESLAAPSLLLSRHSSLITHHSSLLCRRLQLAAEMRDQRVQPLVAAHQGAELAAEDTEVEPPGVARRLAVEERPAAVEEVGGAEAEAIDVGQVVGLLGQRAEARGD